MNRFWSDRSPSSNPFPRAPTDRTRRNRLELDSVSNKPVPPPWNRRSRNSTPRLYCKSSTAPLPELVITLPPAASFELPWITRKFVAAAGTWMANGALSS